MHFEVSQFDFSLSQVILHSAGTFTVDHLGSNPAYFSDSTIPLQPAVVHIFSMFFFLLRPIRDSSISGTHPSFSVSLASCQKAVDDVSLLPYLIMPCPQQAEQPFFLSSFMPPVLLFQVTPKTFYIWNPVVISSFWLTCSLIRFSTNLKGLKSLDLSTWSVCFLDYCWNLSNWNETKRGVFTEI